MKNVDIKIAPSILSADFANMASEIISLENSGADIIHCDVMDGVFVPNITFGIKMISDIRKVTSLPLDCHLMIVEPEKYVEAFAKAGADFITVHYEACKDNLADVLKLIKSFGVKCGAVINPNTKASVLDDVLPLCDMVLVMSVYPGFGGQSFIGETLDNVKYLRAKIDQMDKDILLEIDGGINNDTVKLAKDAGANVIVSGNTIFKAESRAHAISSLKNV